MFTHNSSVGKIRVLGRMVSLVFVLGLVMGALVLAGCPMDDDADFDNDLGSLVGKWATPYSGYEITGTTLTYDDGAAPGTAYDGYDFISDIAYVHKFSTTAGVIIVNYTRAPSGSTAGKYQGVYFKDLATNQVILGNAYTVADYTAAVEVNTLDEAKAKFTPAGNITLYGGDLANSSPYSRQP